jgi:5-methylcytosine-specific restriction endonuclease McrA
VDYKAQGEGEMKKEKTDQQKEGWYRREMKVAWGRCSPEKWKAVARAKLGVNQYRCESCKKTVIYKLIEVDHVHPVINPVTGYQGLAEWAKRLNCPASELQVLCDSCHKAKSKGENKVRREGK